MDQYLLERDVPLYLQAVVSHYFSDLQNEIQALPIDTFPPIALAGFVDVMAFRIMLTTAKHYVIVYMGHQHTAKILKYLQEYVSIHGHIHYTQPSIQSSSTPSKTPVQCIRIPVENHSGKFTLSMNHDVFQQWMKQYQDPPWKVAGRRSKRKKRHAKKNDDE